MSGLYTRLCANVLFPLHERLKGHDTVALRKRLERSQWFGREQILAEQGARLRTFLGEAGRRVPYYRELFARVGFDPHGVRAASDLQVLPLLGKPEIRSHLQGLMAEGHGPLTRYNTGGSSGEPLIFYIGKGRKSHDVAAKWRATRWWGVDIGDPELVVWGSPIELGAQDRLRALRDCVLRSVLLPAFEMSDTKLDGFIATIRRERPAMLFGYPSALAHIARHARQRGVAMDDLGIKVVFVTSERLYDEQRDEIRSVFGCPVANGYGGRDAGFIAHECPAGSLHLSAEDMVVEVVDPQGRALADGLSGEIVVTHLASGDFPFVRYRTGDVGVIDHAPCACGRGLPSLRELQGRTTDFVVAADGTVMHGLALIYVVRDLEGVKSFKVTQESLGLTRVDLVPGPGFDPACVAAIISGFKRRLGAGVDVRVRLTEVIEPEQSGKHRYIVSHALGASGTASHHA